MAVSWNACRRCYYKQAMLDKPNASGPKGSDHQEIEWQFDVPDTGAVERWARRIGEAGGISAGCGQTLRLADRYYDTGDWTLWRSGYALRVRSQGEHSEATLKSLARAGEEGIKRRREISEPLLSAGIEELKGSEGPVAARLRALTGGLKLVELFEVRTRRLSYPLSGQPEGASSVTGELAVDETEISTPGAEQPTRIDRVEVEAGAGGPEGLEPFVSELREACGLTPASVSKFGTGLEVCGTLRDSHSNHYSGTKVKTRKRLEKKPQKNLQKASSGPRGE